MENAREFILKGLILDPSSNTPIVILQDVAETTIIPIWIGIFEANAIAVELEKIQVPRPLTHDLMKNLLQQLSITMEKVVVTDLVDSTYFAEIHLTVQGRPLVIDSRPSDGMALAVRMSAKIYVSDEVIRKSRTFSTADKENLSEEDLQKWLEELSPESLGKYQM